MSEVNFDLFSEQLNAERRVGEPLAEEPGAVSFDALDLTRPEPGGFDALAVELESPKPEPEPATFDNLNLTGGPAAPVLGGKKVIYEHDKGLKDNLKDWMGVREIRTPDGEGWKAIKKVANKLYDRALGQAKDLVEPVTARVDAFEEGGLAGLGKENIKRTGLAGAAAVEAWDRKDDLPGFAKDQVARLFGAKDHATFVSRTPSELLSGFMATIGKEAGTGLAKSVGTPELGVALGEKGGEFGGQAVAGGLKLGAAQLPLVAEAAVTTDWMPLQEDHAIRKITHAVYESVTGRRWHGEKEMAKLRLENPREWQKVSKAQSTLPAAVSAGIVEMAQGIGSLALDPTVLLNPNTLMAMAGNQMSDFTESVDNPEKRMFEDPLGFALDVNPIPVVGAVARASEASRMFRAAPTVKGLGEAAQTAVGLPGPSGLLRALPKSDSWLPKNMLRGDVINNAAKAKAYDNVMSTVLRENGFARELIETAPDISREAVAFTRESRHLKAAAQERINRVSKDLASDAGIGVSRLKGIPKNKGPSTPEGLEFVKYTDDLAENGETLQAFAALHDLVSERITRAKVASFAGVPHNPMDLKLLNLLDDPNKLMAAAQDPAIMKYLDGGPSRSLERQQFLQSVIQVKKSSNPEKYLHEIQASAAAHRGSTRQLMKNAPNEAEKAKYWAALQPHLKKAESVKKAYEHVQKNKVDVNKLQQELDEARTFDSGVRKYNDEILNGDHIKEHGAWLERDGQPLGSVRATFDILESRRRGMSIDDIYDSVQVAGANPRMRGIMERAKEIARIASWQDSRLVHHGLMKEGQAAAQFAARFNRIRDPIRAADFDPAAIALNPHVHLEQGMLVHNLDYLEELGSKIRVVDEGLVTLSGQVKMGATPVAAGRVDGVDYVRLPSGSDSVHGLDVPRYGALAGKWVPRDAADMISNVVGVQRTMLQNIVQPLVKNAVVNNSSSHINALAGEAITSAAAGVDIATAWPRAYRMMQGRGSESERMLGKFALEEAGVFDGAALRSMDELAGGKKNFGDLKDMAEAALGKQAAVDKAFRNVFSEQLQGAYRAYYDKVQGLGGMMEHMWNARDKLVRLSLFERGLQNVALHRFNMSAKDLAKPANMRRVLADKDATTKALEFSVDYALDYLSLPRGPRLPDMVGGRGAYQAAKDIGVMPFIAYPIKAGGLWTKEMFTQPAKTKFVTQLQRATWDQLEAEERERRLAGDRPGDRGWLARYGDRSVNFKAMQPVANLPIDLIDEMRRTNGGVLLGPLVEAWVFGKTTEGREILNPPAYFIQQMALTRTQQKITGNGKPGAIEKLTGNAQDPLTFNEIPVRDVLAQIWLPLGTEVALKQANKLIEIERHYSQELKLAELKHSQPYNEQALYNARAKAYKKMMEDSGKLAKFPEPR